MGLQVPFAPYLLVFVSDQEKMMGPETIYLERNLDQ